MMNLPSTFEEFLVYAAIAAFALLLIASPTSKHLKRSHRWRIRSAKKALEKIRSIKHGGQQLTYLRQVDPFVFEEMILLALGERRDIEVRRSGRYTGDGGIDGTVVQKGKERRKILIQAKRYSGYVNKQHLEEFCKTLQTQDADYGLFVHTGKTGTASMSVVVTCKQMKIISGEKLIQLLVGGVF